MSKAANETLSLELALRGYDLTKLYCDTPAQMEIIKIGSISMTLFKRKQKMCVLAVSCLAITILSSCGDLPDETPDPEILDLFETFFRYKFENNASAQKQDAEAYFLEIEGENPSPEFLARFKGHSPPVKKGSEFVMGGGIVIEKLADYQRSDGLVL